MLDKTWCDVCAEADLGMRNAVEFAEDDVVIVEGACIKCGSTIRSEVVERPTRPGDDAG